MILLVRHGPTALNDPKHERIRAWLDVPLSSEGHRVAEHVATVLQSFPIAHVFSSDLQRAAVTAKEVGKKAGVPVTLHTALRPWNLGPEIAGKPVNEVNQKILALVDAPTKHAPDGESFADFVTRFKAFIWPLLHQPYLVAVVTHIRNIKTLEALIAGQGDLHRPTWDHVPAVDPGGIVVAGPNMFRPVFKENDEQKGAGS